MNTGLESHPSRRIRVWALRAIVLAAVSALVVTGVLLVALQALKPHANDATTTLRLGPWTQTVSLPVLLRWGMHPLVLPMLNGRTVRSRAGTWQIQTTRNGNVHATCAPCTLHLAALGTAPVTLTRVVVDVQRGEPDAWKGTIALGDATRADGVDALPAVMRWTAALRPDGLQFKASLPPTPVSTMLVVLGDAVPEASQARVEGSFGFEARGMLNDRGFSKLRVTPMLSGVAVHGLGTEALLTADPPRPPPTRGRWAASHRKTPGRSASHPQTPPTLRLDNVLVRAVLAAEDQRFFEHAGHDLEELATSWALNQRTDARARGASTITQQLAKMVYTGDQRSATRKVREWLYAVEMERTLGKARILQLYLGLAPWGDGVWGAEAAAQHHLGKSSAALAPHEAAWLASLLTAPDAQLARARSLGSVDHARVIRVIDAIRPTPKAQRQAWAEAALLWQPTLQSLQSGQAALAGTPMP